MIPCVVVVMRFLPWIREPAQYVPNHLTVKILVARLHESNLKRVFQERSLLWVKAQLAVNRFAAGPTLHGISYSLAKHVEFE